MSSATSIEGQAPGTWRVWHFFVIAAFVGATAAVLITRETTPENLLLVSLTVLAAGCAGAGVHRMLAPLVTSELFGGMPMIGGRARAALDREKQLVLRSIKELEFDRAMGKVADADFHDMVARLRARAIGLMKQLDERHPAYRDLIERELRERLGVRGETAPDRPVARAGLFCTQCGTPNELDARFCKACGQRIA